tara:strand:+ start:45 stop:185 length:141 start_codon:yes stop_codon:yes gene_type:complete
MTISSSPVSDLPICTSVHMENRFNGEVFDIVLYLKPVVEVLFTIDI